MAQELNTTIRITMHTKIALSEYGRFQDTYSDIIQRIIDENKQLKSQLKHSPKPIIKKKVAKKKKLVSLPDDIERSQ